MRKIAVALYQMGDSLATVGYSCDSSDANNLEVAINSATLNQPSSENLSGECCRAHMFIRLAIEIFDAAEILDKPEMG
ncbi:hypothetical protein ABZW96_37480 [Nocardia sp. NPDC004168]|uniref:hypothetical protein n=1 Tax=Nocardia sp. NPDC004168 TaxID=3154452 RepID=UPI00339DD6E9